MYDCRLVKDETNEVIRFTIFQQVPDTVIATLYEGDFERSNTALTHEQAELLKEEYANKGFREL